MRVVLLVLLLVSSVLHAITAEQSSFFKQFFKKGDLVFDVGALVGGKADLYLECGARVVCIEPQPLKSEYLRRKYQGRNDVSIVQKGCADSIGELEFAMSSKAPPLSTFSKEWREDGRYGAKAKRRCNWDTILKIPTITLDSLIHQYGCPKFCKIDVENFEYEVLKGLSQSIPYLCFEFHIEMIHNAKKCIQHLESLGYTGFNCTIYDAYTLHFDEWLDGKTLLSLLQSTAEKKDSEDLLWGDIYAYCER